MNNKQPTPHPHAELICKWANEGVRIQKYMSTVEDWRDDANPQWLPQCKYRIKPEEAEAWKPKDNERVWIVNAMGYAESVRWANGARFCDECYAHGNCFRTEEEAKAAIPRVSDALKGENFAKDINVPTNVSGNVGSPELDGKPLSDGEKALIRAFRNGRLCRQFSGGSSLIIEGHNKVPCGVTTHDDFVAFFMYSPMQNGEVRNALEQIKAEQEVQDEEIQTRPNRHNKLLR